nr:hypothetical protein [Tanacetum cinerariifolium]
ASLHEVIEMARELVKQSIQSKAARANAGGKRKWDDNRRGVSYEVELADGKIVSTN